MNKAELIRAEIRKIQEQLRGAKVTLQDRQKLSRRCELLKQKLADLEGPKQKGG